MKTAPFNLEKALSGHPVVTRDGRNVTQLVLLNAKGYPYPLVGVLEGPVVYHWGEDGVHPDHPSKLDLFLAVKTEKRWARVVTVEGLPCVDSWGYLTKESAEKESSFAAIEYEVTAE